MGCGKKRWPYRHKPELFLDKGYVLVPEVEHKQRNEVKKHGLLT